jgi:eukaryotic-like serine/threonine-protein kinase
MLTCAAHLHVLTTQLEGKRASIEDAVRAVRATWTALRDVPPTDRSRSTTPLDAVPATYPRTVPMPESAPLAGRYRILEPREHSGAGRSYLASDDISGDRIALQVIRKLPPRKIDTAVKLLGAPDSPYIALDHRNVARLYAVGIAEGDLYVATELVEGPTVREWLAEKHPLTVEEGTFILRQLVSGAAAIHRAGLIHGELSPDTIAMAAETEVVWKITGLGIASADLTDDRELHITMAEAPIGNIAYSSPEALNDEVSGPSSDIYSLGIIAYEIFSGTNPFYSPSPHQCLMNHLEKDAAPLISLRPDIGDARSAIIAKCLAKDPLSRFASAVELEASLRQLS